MLIAPPDTPTNIRSDLTIGGDLAALLPPPLLLRLLLRLLPVRAEVGAAPVSALIASADLRGTALTATVFLAVAIAPLVSVTSSPT